MQDRLGERGEAIARLRLTEIDRGVPRFRPVFLGDKWPFIDLFVQLEGVPGQIPYFLAQVKTTQRLRQTRLPVHMDRTRMLGLLAYPAPTYIIGVDASAETAYLVSPGKKRTGFSSMTIQFPLNHENRRRLWSEVRDFWQSTPSTIPSVFLDPTWRS